MNVGDEDAFGTKAVSVCAKECLMEVAEAIGWGQPFTRGEGRFKKGRGIALAGRSFAKDSSSAIVKIWEDGTIEIRSSVVDMGQGSHTILAQIAAEEFKVPLEMIRLANICFPSSGGS